MAIRGYTKRIAVVGVFVAFLLVFLAGATKSYLD
jgi:hypothetical protein